MELLSNKVNRGAGANYQLPAEEWNQVPKEIENIISAFGISLSDADLNQLGKAVAGYVGSADFFTDSGVANSIVLSAIGTKQAPTGYTNGQRVRFRAAATNSGATVINVASVGSKKVRTQTDTALAAGNIVAGTQYELTYNTAFDSGAGAFVLVVPSAITNTFPQGYKYGCTLSNNALDATNDIDISAGSLKDSTNALDMVVGSAIGKRIDAAWTAGGTVGATVGGFPTGITLTNNTWYRVFVIAKADGTTDAGFDSSVNAANLLADATGFSYYRHVGWIRRATAANVLFFQVGNMFVWSNPAVDVFHATPTSTATLHTVSVPPDVNCVGEFQVKLSVITGTPISDYFGLYTATRQPDVAPSSTAYTITETNSAADTEQTGSMIRLPSDSSSQIRSRFDTTSATAGNLNSIVTTGWIDSNI